MWFVEPLEIADDAGNGTGRWRMTAKSNDGGGGPHGDTSHDHATAEEASACHTCHDYIAGITGMRSPPMDASATETRERAELARLKAKYE